MRRFLAATRYIALIPVICIFFAATALLIYGAVETVQVILHAFTDEVSSKGAKSLLLAAIELVDLFLLGTVLYVIAVGLYELFVDDTLPLPHWLEIHDLDDLKEKLIGVVIVVLGVLFLGQVISWDGQLDLLSPGAAVALVIAALAYFLSLKKKEPKDKA
ncbi:YqhA family protein [Oscillochloris sp. ZM17-4]|uniref:YqhA family protein n=1 Tax=Oscillochloris sp. ZM17-4 TaxID=2866714 RepID=UPI001C73D9AB|nr:YqhA family protein [Oscillochloris sp. ZM17-4]MBX0329036.1 YqhA family protein [Oscillochloris sp. ZM17-4]